MIVLKDRALWRIARRPNDPEAQRCPQGRVKRCIFITAGLWPIDMDGGRILGERRSKSRKLLLVSATGHVLQTLPLIYQGDGALLRGRTVYAQHGRTLTRYELGRRRVTGHWVVGRPDSLLDLEDIRNGLAAYVDAISETISGSTTARWACAFVPIPLQKLPDHKLWSADAAGFDHGGLYYQYTETKSDVVDRSIVRFIPQKRLKALVAGG